MVTLAVIVVSLLVAWLLDLWWYELKPLTLAGAQLATIFARCSCFGPFRPSASISCRCSSATAARMTMR